MNRRNLLKGLVALTVSPVVTTTPTPVVTRQAAKTMAFAACYGAPTRYGKTDLRAIITENALKDMQRAEDDIFMKLADEINANPDWKHEVLTAHPPCVNFAPRTA